MVTMMRKKIMTPIEIGGRKYETGNVCGGVSWGRKVLAVVRA